MTYKEAMSLFNRRFPKLIITRCIDYDTKYFIVEAVENVDSTDYNSPYYAVDKSSGKVTSFIPSFDLDAFFDAVENRTVYSA